MCVLKGWGLRVMMKGIFFRSSMGLGRSGVWDFNDWRRRKRRCWWFSQTKICPHTAHWAKNWESTKHRPPVLPSLCTIPLKTYMMNTGFLPNLPKYCTFLDFFRALYYSSPSIPIITAGNYSPSLKATIKVQSSAVVPKVMVDFSSPRPIVFKFL